MLQVSSISGSDTDSDDEPTTSKQAMAQKSSQLMFKNQGISQSRPHPHAYSGIHACTSLKSAIPSQKGVVLPNTLAKQIYGESLLGI